MRIIFVISTGFVQDLKSQLAGELHAQIPVFISEGVAPSQIHFRQSVAQILAVFIIGQVSSRELNDFPVRLFNQEQSVFRHADRLQAIKLT